MPLRVWCFEEQCALPCDAEAPFACTICFIELWRYPKFTTDIKPKVVVLPKAPSVNMGAPTMPSIAR